MKKIAILLSIVILVLSLFAFTSCNSLKDINDSDENHSTETEINEEAATDTTYVPFDYTDDSPAAFTVDGMPVSVNLYKYYLSVIKLSLSAGDPSALENSFWDGLYPNSDKTYKESAINSADEIAVVISNVNKTLANYQIIESPADQENRYMAMEYVIGLKGGNQMYSEYMKKAGITELDLVAPYILSDKFAAIMEHLYSANGPDPITDEEVNESLKNDYARIKHILVLLPTDESSTIEENEARANVLLDRVNGGEDFESLVAEFSEDPGSATNPDGYYFTASGNYVQEFMDAGLSMEIGEVRMVLSSYGWHIMKKYDPTEKTDNFEEIFTQVKSSISQTRFSYVIDAWISNAVIGNTAKKDAIDFYAVELDS